MEAKVPTSKECCGLMFIQMSGQLWWKLSKEDWNNLQVLKVLIFKLFRPTPDVIYEGLAARRTKLTCLLPGIPQRLSRNAGLRHIWRLPGNLISVSGDVALVKVRSRGIVRVQIGTQRRDPQTRAHICTHSHTDSTNVRRIYWNISKPLDWHASDAHGAHLEISSVIVWKKIYWKFNELL